MPQTFRLDETLIETLKGAPRIVKHGAIAVLNNHEVVFAPYVESTKQRYVVWGIRKYNIHSNKWHRFIPYPKRFISPYHIIEFNKRTNKLYFYAQYTDCEHITMLDIKRKKFETIKTNYSRQDPGLSPCILNVNGLIHILASETTLKAKHCIWNENNLSLQTIQYCPTTLYRAASVFIPNKKMIILFRWYEIWIYSLITNKWKQLDLNGLSLKLTYISAVLTSNQKHIIIKGRKINQATTNIGYIKVLDIADNEDNFMLRQNTIKIPTIGSSFFWKSSDKKTDEMLLVGYIRNEFYSYSNLMMPPLYIMQFIGKWYSEEMIHWVAKKIRNRDKTRKHYALPIKKILNLTKNDES